MRNLIASGLVAFAVSSVVAGASPTPTTPLSEGHTVLPALSRVSHASTADRLAALTRRVDTLQRRLADTRSIAMTARTTSENAAMVTKCISGGTWITSDPTTNDVAYGAGTEADSLIVATLDPKCLAVAS